MKIDFQASFRQLDALIRAPLSVDKSRTNSSNFTKLLSNVAPQTGQVSEFTSEKAKVGSGLLPSKSAASEARAGFDFAQPSLKFGDFARLGPGNSAEQLVKEAPPGVKTPAILDAHRLGGMEETEAQTLLPVEEPHASLSPSAMPIVPRSQQTSMDAVANLVLEAGKRHGVDPSLSMAVVSAESNFDSRAVSSDGHASKGLFQLLDSTGKDLLQRSGETASYEPFNPALNSNLGVGYLRYLHDLFSKETAVANDLKTVAAANSSSLEKLAVAAFNAGEGRVASAQQRASKGGLDAAIYENVEAYLPENTQEYVQKVISSKRDFESRFIG